MKEFLKLLFICGDQSGFEDYLFIIVQGAENQG